tara:strand:- start:260 stop:454 length:195 start_codon:yes stop_codon:yes gene_type:complete
MTIETTTLETTTNNLRTAALQMSLRAQFDKVQREIEEEEGRPLDTEELEAFFLTYAALGPSAEA